MSKYSRFRSCAGKAKFDSEEVAMARAQEIAAERPTGRVPRRAYRCRWCFFWHLTAQRGRVRQ